MNTESLLSPRQAVRFLRMKSLAAFHSRLWLSHMGIPVKDAGGEVISRRVRRGFRLKSVAGPLYGKTSETKFRKSDVEKFGSHLRTRGGRVSSIIEKIRAPRPSQKAQARSAKAKVSMSVKTPRPSQKAQARSKAKTTPRKVKAASRKVRATTGRGAQAK